MPDLILIETATSLCSVALAVDGRIVDYRESSEPRSHASLTAVFIDEILRANGRKVSDCDAVCVSSGPGSYTGLRVGSSTAKGLCFGAGLPLIAVCTLDILAHKAISQKILPEGCKHIIPMIDARRMEVYAAVYDSTAQRTGEIEPVVVDGDSYGKELEDGPVLFIGDGAGKCADVLKHHNAKFVQCLPDASSMLVPAMKAFNEKRFENTAYFEPFYLKQFVASLPKKNLF